MLRFDFFIARSLPLRTCAPAQLAPSRTQRACVPLLRADSGPVRRPVSASTARSRAAAVGGMTLVAACLAVGCSSTSAPSDPGRDFLPDTSHGDPDAPSDGSVAFDGGEDAQSSDETGPSDVAPIDGAEPELDATGPDAERPDIGAGDTDGGGEPVDPERDAIRVATFNTEFFFDTVCDSGNCGPGDFELVFNDAQHRFKARSIAEGVLRLEADAVCLQEVESQASVDALLDALPEDWTVGEIGETGGPASLDVAVVARGRLISSRGWRDERPLALGGGRSTTFTRELLEVDLEINGGRVIIFCAHFRSKNNDDPTRRLAEARESRDIVLERHALRPNLLHVLAGDLNDEPGSAPIRALEEGGRMWRVASGLSDAEAGTYRFQGVPVAIDHLYVPTVQQDRLLPGSVRVVRDANGTLGGSDHAGLRAAFTRSAP